MLDLDQPTLGISREYLVAGLQHREVAAYLSYMVDIATMLGADRQQAELEMLEVVQFEMELANISLSREERRDSVSLYNPMTISDLYQLDPTTPWLDHINNLLTKVGTTFQPAALIVVLSGDPAGQCRGEGDRQRTELRARSEFSAERQPGPGDGELPDVESRGLLPLLPPPPGGARQPHLQQGGLRQDGAAGSLAEMCGGHLLHSRQRGGLPLRGEILPGELQEGRGGDGEGDQDPVQSDAGPAGLDG